MRLYESILDGTRRYHVSGTLATKHVGGKRTDNHEVAAIDTASIPTKGLLIAALNGEEWVGKRTVLHSKGETRATRILDRVVAEAAAAPVTAPTGGGSHHPSEFPQGVQAAFWSVLNTLRARKPGEPLDRSELAYMELSLERCAGASGVIPIPETRKAALTAEYGALLDTLD